jgi:hypothetical protein
MASLRLEDFSDRELLFALEDFAGEDGLVSSQALAEGLGINALKHPVQSVAIRLSWLKRYGVVRRDEESGMWGLTSAGESIMHGDLTKAQSRLLDNIDADRLFAVMHAVGGKLGSANAEAAKMAEREWRYNLAARKRRNGR